MEVALRADDRVRLWLCDRLDKKAAQTLMRLQSLPALQRMAVMPDVHPSANVCVGCVLGTAGVVYPTAIGGDIGCGLSAVSLGGRGTVGADDRRRLLREVARSIDVVLRAPGSDPVACETLARARARPPEGARLSDPRLRRHAEGEGVTQLGTLGRGNHFVEFQQDESGGLWIMVHSGSRFMGQAVVRHHTRAAQSSGIRAALPGLGVDTPEGAAYLADQEWCVEYARTSRILLLGAAAGAAERALGARSDWPTVLDAPHNVVRIEEHAGRSLVVHRKGAAPAHVGQVGLIPGSSGTFSVHVEGRGEPAAMASSSHGAGRLFSRSDAKALVTERDVREQMGNVAFEDARARSLRDEAPAVYRDLRVVLEAQRDLVRVVRTLRPIVSFKAGG